MTIKEVEEQTGLTRSNVRFYEKEKLIEPLRNERNGYRDYSKRDVEDLKKIAYLRTLGISIEDIRSVISEKITLQEVIVKQSRDLASQMADLNRAKAMCERMLEEKHLSYRELQVERYVGELQDYWSDNQQVFKLDAVSFVYLWGSFAVWAAITALCLIISVLSYTKLPPEIPVQWSDGTASAMADRMVIFAYPAVCVAIRYLLKPVIYARLRMDNLCGERMTEYLINYLCFLALSAEVFTVLFIYGLVKNIVTVLAVDTIVLIGLLIAGVTRETRSTYRKF